MVGRLDLDPIYHQTRPTLANEVDSPLVASVMGRVSAKFGPNTSLEQRGSSCGETKNTFWTHLLLGGAYEVRLIKRLIVGGPLAGTQPFEKLFFKTRLGGSKQLLPSGTPIN
jgi:hypothetical protein